MYILCICTIVQNVKPHCQVYYQHAKVCSSDQIRFNFIDPKWGYDIVATLIEALHKEERRNKLHSGASILDSYVQQQQSVCNNKPLENQLPLYAHDV